jgi:hypothetical protein
MPADYRTVSDDRVATIRSRTRPERDRVTADGIASLRAALRWARHEVGCKLLVVAVRDVLLAEGEDDLRERRVERLAPVHDVRPVI